MLAARFTNVAKEYRTAPWRRGVAALRGVSLEVPAGSTFALLGPNRAGKTTLVKILLGLARPSGGAVERLGTPLRDRRTLGRVGTMHENHAFPRYLGARDVLHFCGGLTGLSGPPLQRRAAALLERVGLADRAAEPIARFSKGMVQRLGMAQALLAEPDLLILDEPTEGLDLFGRQLLRDVVREQKAAGKTTLLVSHVLPEIEELCDELAVVVGGRLAHRGTVEKLRLGPAGAARPLEEALRTVYERGNA